MDLHSKLKIIHTNLQVIKLWNRSLNSILHIIKQNIAYLNQI